VSFALPAGWLVRPPGRTMVYGIPLARSAASPFSFSSIREYLVLSRFRFGFGFTCSASGQVQFRFRFGCSSMPDVVEEQPHRVPPA